MQSEFAIAWGAIIIVATSHIVPAGAQSGAPPAPPDQPVQASQSTPSADPKPAAAALSGAAAEVKLVTTAPLDPQVDKILTRLEQRKVEDLRAKLTWRLTNLDGIEEDDTTSKFGRIWYREFDPVPKFLIRFDKKVAGGGGRVSEVSNTYLFDGIWFVEVQDDRKMIIRREIRRPNDPRNPFKIESGQFPVPFGQKKSEIVREFTVELVPPDPKDPKGTRHLLLTPRPSARIADTYSRLEFWVVDEGDKLEGLPIRVVAGRKDGTGRESSYVTIDFEQIELNTGMSSSEFEIKTPSGYEEEIERLPEEPPAGPGKP